MAKHLADVVREARENAGRKPFHIAAAQPGERSVNPSTVYRFEHQHRWPRNPDLLVNLYAADLDIAPIELWEAALERWRLSEAAAAGLPAPELGGLADRVEQAADPTPQRADGRRGSGRPANPRRTS